MCHPLESRQREEKDMRSITKSIVLLALSISAALLPTTASAQILDRALGILSAGTAYGYNSCSYVGGGVQSAACQANRAFTALNSVRQGDFNTDYRRQQKFHKRTQQLDALQRACQAGDRESCSRSGGSDPQQMTIARALNDACIAGDKSSCRRAESIMDERNIARDDRQVRYEQPLRRRQDAPRYDRVASQDCSPVIDARTGYRIIGQMVCR
jgi:hypothetical protein